MTTDMYDNLIKLAVALLMGSVIGAEREFKSKAAGFRTVILIMVGSTLFTIISNKMGSDARVAANIITGIGFLGAGAIFKEGVSVQGLTSAATIWISAAIGMAIGIGQYEFAGASLVIAMLVLLGFSWLQQIIDHTSRERTYRITVDLMESSKLEAVDTLFKGCQVKASRVSQRKEEGYITITYSVKGSELNHEMLVKKLFNDPTVKAFEV